MRVVSDEQKFLMQQEDIERARNRVDRVETEDDTETFRGRLLFLSSSRRFELYVSRETVLSGTIANTVIGNLMSDTGMPIPGVADTWCVVKLRVRKVTVRGQATTRNYQLVEIMSFGGKDIKDVY